MPKPKYSVFDNPSYEKFIRGLPCLICDKSPVDGHHVDHARANSYMLVPLCRNHHTFGKDSYHNLERNRFEDVHRLNMDWEIIRLMSEFIEVEEKVKDGWKKF